MISNTIPKTELETGREYSGFICDKKTNVEALRAEVWYFTHKKTGASLIHVLNSNENKLFAIGFKTPPPDDTGVAHILEHSVLGGSRKFAVKDPFNEMARGSMATFINAFTFPDKTIYPVSSQIEKDFYNLVDVYLDAVFYPKLTEMTFGQEGHHLEFAELENPASELQIKGIVYNEMKGAYGNLDSIVQEYNLRHLLPDTAYGKDSGGDPEQIPELTYENFKEFHRRYYHPSNSRIYVSGELDIRKMLAYLEDNYLGDFEPLTIDNQIPRQPRWEKPRREQVSYPAQEQEENEHTLTINWLLGDILDPVTTTGLALLEEILVGDSGSVLRKTLIESGLGSALAAGTGLTTEIRETYFSVGLRGVSPDNLTAVENLIHGVLKDFAQTGFSDRDLERAFHQLEFQNSELRGGGVPFDIGAMVTAFQAWLYDGDPVTYMDLRPHLDAVQKKLKANPDWLVELLTEYFLENRHQLTIDYTPDTEYVQKREGKLATELRARRDSMDEATRKKIIEYSKALLTEQQRPNSPEELSTLPSIGIEDIPPETRDIPGEVHDHDGGTVIHNPLFTNGISYLSLYFDISRLPELDKKAVAWLPVLSLALSGQGLDSRQYKTEGEELVLTYDEFANWKSLKTGRVGAEQTNTAVLESPENLRTGFQVSGKALERNIDEMVSIIKNTILFSDLENKERLRDLLKQQRAGLQSALVPRGIRYAWIYGAAQLRPGLWYRENWSGVHYLRHLNEILETDLNETVTVLKKLRETVFQPENLTLQIIGEKDIYDQTLKAVEENLLPALGNLPASRKMEGADPDVWRESFFTGFPPADQKTDSGRHFFPLPGREDKARFIGLELSTPVSYAAMLFETVSREDQRSPYFYFLNNFLSSGYLNDRVRIQGGAYGGLATNMALDGVMGFGSYRDPNIVASTRAFLDCLDYLRAGDFDAEEVRRALIGSFSGLDSPLTPAGAGSVWFSRYLTGNNRQRRQEFRERLRELDAPTLKRELRSVLEPPQKLIFSILAHPDKLAGLRRELEIPAESYDKVKV